jgi:hypothetical protein
VSKARGEDPLETPLGQLLERASYGTGEARALERRDLDRHCMVVLRWITLRKPASGKKE